MNNCFVRNGSRDRQGVGIDLGATHGDESGRIAAGQPSGCVRLQTDSVRG
jgi:hypothetical protein